MGGTTILCVKHNNKVVIGGDGQVTLGSTVVKHDAKKIRKLYDGKILVGFSGSVADSLSLLERLELMLKKYNGNLLKSCVELAKEWRMDKALRKLESLLICADKENVLLLSGSGDVIESKDGIIAIGSGGPFAQSAAKALVKFSNLSTKQIVEESLKIAGEICIYTNSNIYIEEL
ncbi:MAG: ATP-dependent protease subunit HslV [Planctomycetota bacterium]